MSYAPARPMLLIYFAPLHPLYTLYKPTQRWAIARFDNIARLTIYCASLQEIASPKNIRCPKNFARPELSRTQYLSCDGSSLRMTHV